MKMLREKPGDFGGSLRCHGGPGAHGKALRTASGRQQRRRRLAKGWVIPGIAGAGDLAHRSLGAAGAQPCGQAGASRCGVGGIFRAMQQ
jgi:hypothetical protein